MAFWDAPWDGALTGVKGRYEEMRRARCASTILRREKKKLLDNFSLITVSIITPSLGSGGWKWCPSW